MNDQADRLIHAVESLQGPISEEQANEIRFHIAGKELAALVDIPGWAVALEMLAGYVNRASHSLLDMAPGDPRVPNAHAAASALTDLYKKFIQDVSSAVEMSKTTPDTVKLAYSKISAIPAEMS